MPTNIRAATSTNGGVFDPATGDGGLDIYTGATSGAQVKAASFAADGKLTLLHPMQGGSLTLGTAVATTSGTAIDFTGIPSWVKKITVMLKGVSLSGTSLIQLRIGPGSAPDTTGYVCTAGWWDNTTSKTAVSYTSGFVVPVPFAAADTVYGSVVLTLQDSATNTWVVSGSVGSSYPALAVTGGYKALSGSLGVVRITTINGTDTFDAGSVNILYEG